MCINVKFNHISIIVAYWGNCCVDLSEKSYRSSKTLQAVFQSLYCMQAMKTILIRSSRHSALVKTQSSTGSNTSVINSIHSINRPLSKMAAENSNESKLKMDPALCNTPSHTNVCKSFDFQLTFCQLILHLKC